MMEFWGVGKDLSKLQRGGNQSDMSLLGIDESMALDRVERRAIIYAHNTV